MPSNPPRSIDLFWAAVMVSLLARARSPLCPASLRSLKPTWSLSGWSAFRILWFSRCLGPWKSTGRLWHLWSCIPVIVSNDLTVEDQAYSQFLFREVASPILPLAYICRHVEQLCIFSSWSSALTHSLSWIDLSSA